MTYPAKWIASIIRRRRRGCSKCLRRAVICAGIVCVEANVRHWGFVFATHYSAVIEEIGEGEGADGRGRFADSWFVDNGQAAVAFAAG